jgi:hypothetical protein
MRWVVFSDSLSSLQAIESMYPKTNPILTEIQDELAVIKNKHINFVWTPGYARIEGNEKADEAAKEALQQCLLPELTVVVADMIAKAKFKAKRIVERNWQQSDSPMIRFKKSIGRLKLHAQLNRREQMIIYRLRMCHNNLTHSHHMRGETPLICEQCNATTTVAHILLECVRYRSHRIKHNIDETCLDNDYDENLRIIKFMKDIGLIDSI